MYPPSEPNPLASVASMTLMRSRDLRARRSLLPRAVQANRVNLVNISERIVPLGELHDPADRGDVSVHRIKALENDQLHAIATRLDQQLLETRDIIVPPDFLFAT
jgi:hypothetical protein